MNTYLSYTVEYLNILGGYVVLIYILHQKANKHLTCKENQFYIFIFLSSPTNDECLQNDKPSLTFICCNLNNDVLYALFCCFLVYKHLKFLHHLDDSARTAVLLNLS